MRRHDENEYKKMRCHSYRNGDHCQPVCGFFLTVQVTQVLDPFGIALVTFKSPDDVPYGIADITEQSFGWLPEYIRVLDS